MSVFGDVQRDCVVDVRTVVADGVVALELVAANGRDLPPWDAGAHVDLLLPGPDGVLERQYSLCGDPADRTRYRVAVLLEAAGGRGSALVHERLVPGAPVRIRGPRNHFGFTPPAAGAPVVLLAGGIGVTPLVAVARAAAVAGVDFTLVLAGSSRTATPFADELVARHGPRVHLHPADTGDRVRVAELVAGIPDGGALYCCGPARMVAEVEAVCAQRPGIALHVERFVARELGEPVWQEPFEVELDLTGTTVTVVPGTSILDAVEAQGVLVASSCRTGTCGTCETPVLDGPVEHRDSVLTPDEQAHGDTMMICVSRAAGPRLVLDL